MSKNHKRNPQDTKWNQFGRGRKLQQEKATRLSLKVGLFFFSLRDCVGAVEQSQNGSGKCE